MSRRGQALIEFLLAGIFGLTAVCFTFLCSLKILYTLAIDELLETYSICRLTSSPEPLCESALRRALAEAGFKNIRLNAKPFEIAVEAQVTDLIQLSRAREYKFK